MKHSFATRIPARWFVLAALILPQLARTINAQEPRPGQSPVVNVSNVNQRFEMIVNTSRILTLEEKIPRAQVNNPEIIELTPLSPTQVQIFAKRPGVTQVNLWNQRDQVRSIDVIVFGDAQELSMVLQSQFPKAALRVIPLSNSVVISGFVNRPEEVSRVVRIAEDFYPKVINNINVGGPQQVLLHVKVLEVSRTKMRELGVDFNVAGSSGNFFISSISGLLSSGGAPGISDTVRFGILGNSASFFGFISALQQKNIAKIMAEPTLVTVNGRPATFRVGGEFPILVPQSLGTVAIQFKTYGTQVDFVPIVMGNGRIRLEIRPRVSELDQASGITLLDTTVPGLRVREVDTGVELNAGQTLALAGLVQSRVEAEHRSLPIIGDLPYLGVPFRRVQERINEIELLVLVTPELIDAMDPHEVPPLGPAMHSDSPTDGDLYFRGHIEVPSQPMLQNGPYYRTAQRSQYSPAPQGQQVRPQAPPPANPQAAPSAPPAQSGRLIQPRPLAASGRIEPSRVTGFVPASDSGSGNFSAVSVNRSGTSFVPRNNQYTRSNSPIRPAVGPQNGESSGPGFIGPVGYDVQQ